MTALLERCAPSQPADALMAVVRKASGFEPLIVGVTQNGKLISILPTSKEDAIAFVAESKVAGQRIRIGLAGLDSRDLDRLGVSVADALEPCANLQAAARLLGENPNALNTARVASTTAAPTLAMTGHLPREHPASSSSLSHDRDRKPAASGQARFWDVYGQAGTSAALVYAAPE